MSLIGKSFMASRARFSAAKSIFSAVVSGNAKTLSARLLDVSAEFVAHRRQHPVGEVRLAARAEALIECGRQDMRGDRFVDRRLDRPAPLARVRNPPCEP